MVLDLQPFKLGKMQFGNDVTKLRFAMYGNYFLFVNEYKYLGVIVLAGKCFSTLHMSPLIKFQISNLLQVLCLIVK